MKTLFKCLLALLLTQALGNIKFASVSNEVYYSSGRQFLVLRDLPKSHLGYLWHWCSSRCPWSHTLPCSYMHKITGVPPSWPLPQPQETMAHPEMQQGALASSGAPGPPRVWFSLEGPTLENNSHHSSCLCPDVLSWRLSKQMPYNPDTQENIVTLLLSFINLTRHESLKLCLSSLLQS